MPRHFVTPGPVFRIAPEVPAAVGASGFGISMCRSEIPSPQSACRECLDTETQLRALRDVGKVVEM